MLQLRPEFRSAAARHDALDLADKLEEMIERGTATTQDREAALEVVRQWPQKTAEYSYARAQLVGRVAQTRGLTAPLLLGEMEEWARRSVGYDPEFRDGAAKRMLGTLYVLAPASLLDHGDSEEGLALLEEVYDSYPDNPVNALRLAEGYVSLNDPDPAYELLCEVHSQKRKLRSDERDILATLTDALGGMAELGCEDADDDDEEE